MFSDAVFLSYLRHCEMKVGGDHILGDVLSGSIDFEPAYALRAFRHLVDSHAVAAHSRFLDLGSGDGTIVAAGLRAGFDSYGLDLNEVAVERANEKFRGLRRWHLVPPVVAKAMVGNYLPAEYRFDEQRGLTRASHYPVEAEMLSYPPDTRGNDSYAALGVRPVEFDLFFAYTLASQIPAIYEFFSRYARPDALLLNAVWIAPPDYDTMLRDFGLESRIEPPLDGVAWASELRLSLPPIRQVRKVAPVALQQ